MSTFVDFPKLKEGSRLGHYVIVSQIGEGGMGIVYKALEPELERFVAIKVLHRDMAGDADQRTYFAQEARAVAALRHNNIVPLYYIGEEGDFRYFAMAFIEGETLEDWIDAGRRLDAEWAPWFLSQAISALEYASRYDIIHLDVKPSNFLVDADNIIMLADFGLAQKMTYGACEQDPDRELCGTPAYASPEHILQHATDIRTDIYSLGASLFHLMTGEAPFGGDTIEEVCRGHAFSPFPREAAERAGLSKGWVSLLAKMMEKVPEDRFQTYGELQIAISDIANFRHGNAHLTTPKDHRRRAVPREPQPPEKLFGLIPPEISTSDEERFTIKKTYSTEETVDAYQSRDKILTLNVLGDALRELTTQPEEDLADLVKSMRQLPALKESVHALANFFAQQEGETVGDDAEAIEIVGVSRAHNLALTAWMLRKAWQPARSLDWRPFWQNQIAGGIITELLFDSLGLQPSGLEYAAGLTRDIGKLAFAEMYPNTYLAALMRAVREDIPLVEAELDLYGLGHPELGEMWLTQRRVSTTLAFVTLYHEAPTEAPTHHHAPFDTSRIGLGILSKSFDTRLLVHAVASADHLTKELGLGYNGETYMDQCDWIDLPSTRALWEARQNRELEWSKFTAFFATACKEFPALSIAQYPYPQPKSSGK